MRLGCCNFSVHWLKWWLQSWSARSQGSPQNTDFSGLIDIQLGMSRFFPCRRGESYTVCCNTVDHVQCGGRPQRWVWGCLGGLIRHGSCLSHQCGWVSYAPSEGMETLRLTCEFSDTSPNGEEGILHMRGCVREDIYMIKSTIPPSQGLHLIDLVPFLAQTQFAASSGGAHPLCIWEVTLQTWSQ